MTAMSTEPAGQGSSPVRARAVLRRYVPIIGWLPRYPRAWLSADVIAGITSWAVMVPVAMAYAELAGVPAGIGLVTATIGLTVYALLGTSRHAKVTTSSTMAVMSASVVAPIAGGDAASYLALTSMLAIIVGLYLLAAGVLKLGFLSEFLAKPVITGFLVGLAITIAVGQLPKLFGVAGSSGNVFQQLAGLAQQLSDTDITSLLLGAGAMVVIVVLRAIDRRIPGPLIAVVAAIALTSLLGLAQDGLAVVGDISGGVPVPSLPDIDFSDIAYLATGAAGIFFLALAESVAAARAFANRHGDRIRPDQELIALGGSNLGSGLFGGFTVDASVSSMATGEAAGTRSQVSSLVMAAGLLLTILVLGPLFSNLPQTVLAAIIITSVISLVDLAEWRRYIRWRKTDAAIAVVATISVISTDVLAGLVIAALGSVIILLYSASQPVIARLGRLPEPYANFVDEERHPEAEPVPGMLMLRLDTPLYYFNATAVSDRVLQAVDGAAELPQAVLLDIEATIELDVTTSDALFALAGALESRGTRLVVVHAKGNVRDRMRKVGLSQRLGPHGMYPTEPIAVAALQGLGSWEDAIANTGDPHSEDEEAEMAGYPEPD